MNHPQPYALSLRNWTIHRQGVLAISNITLELPLGACAAIVGANGSGKTTLLQAMAGLLPFQGELMLRGQQIRPRHAAQALQAGVALCPADRGIFHRLTVRENLMVGGHLLPSRHAVAQRVAQLLERFPGLAQRSEVLGGQLSGGERQQLAVARALMMNPAFLLLDEPSRGLSPAAIDILLKTLQELAMSGMTILLADQTLDWLYKHVDRLMILANGRIIADSEEGNHSMEQLINHYFCLGDATAKQSISQTSFEQGS
ncbi:MAG: ATP-binding cassette domain-containing protein [Magnetococcales bacterium]|nr:ATP-binding cassette domain-containing protein [Magnetococcales bacterium]